MDEPRARWTEGEADVRDRAREGDPTGEEFAAEIAPATAPPREKRAVDRAEQTDGSGWAIAGIILSVISLFVLPFLFAPAGVIVGYVAYRQGARTLAWWAIGIGLVSLLGAILLRPFFL
ncbi:DUF4190 domain-containing protein [Calditerricola satsumensis]|uniref:DUF4190 domain-containing protein n=1 Tax=Calditerricola satsumensis TaxID=373054 RepID=A0A8J3FB78_9BACI|nr:DUF4190 domain-containing protein [Calditerricola satsumensis]GGK00729.1 hypothetical protein GCM10007043_13450 [Calditerricola satsumensis]